jgi:hypothetical protein
MGHELAHGLNDAGAFVTKDGAGVGQTRRGVGAEVEVAIDEVKVAVADAGRGGADTHFVTARLVDVDVLDGQRLVGFAENGGLHGLPSSDMSFAVPIGRSPDVVRREDSADMRFNGERHLMGGEPWWVGAGSR